MAKTDVLKIDATSVSNYYFADSDKEFWTIRDKEFYGCRPPEDVVWIEFLAPPFIRSSEHGVNPWDGPDKWGFLVGIAAPETVKAKIPTEEIPDGIEFMISGALFEMKRKKYNNTSLVINLFYKDGKVIPAKNGQHILLIGDTDVIKKLGQDAVEHIATLFHPALLTFTFLNQKKITLMPQPGGIFKTSTFWIEGAKRKIG
jgi:hypothetical protein